MEFTTTIDIKPVGSRFKAEVKVHRGPLGIGSQSRETFATESAARVWAEAHTASLADRLQASLTRSVLADATPS